ncbi:hypothetical protein GQ53DRAFT_791856 [Thozetella sp. PMI_491]|nr:hypothetical protein GQ53DRAFT_791856 [Thozetella sp. PMI_491]
MPAYPVGRTRNGRYQACEPCRRRKVSCGHETPVCARCRRRGTERECVYVPRSSTVPVLVHAERVSAPAPRLPPLAAASTPTGSSEPRAVPSPSGSFVSQEEGQTPSSTSVGSPQLNFQNTGFLGATSFHSVYNGLENMPALGQSEALTPSGGSANHTAALEEVPNATNDQKTAAASATDESALKVLRMIPNEKTGKAIFDLDIHPNDTWSRIASQRIMLSIYDHFGPVLKNGSTGGLLEMARTLTLNSQRPLVENISDGDEWIASFSGENLRWEALGIVFTHWAFATLNRDIDENGEGRAAGSWEVNHLKATRMFHFKAGIEGCMALADPTRNVNTLVVLLHHNHMILETHVLGDAGIAVQGLHAWNVGAIVFIGMHADHPTPSYIPTPASEARRKCFGTIFLMDKLVASFTGRPPLLSRRYTSTPLPLDIPGHVLMMGSKALADAVARLDINGWNTDNQIYPTTIFRGRCSLAYVRDAILEASLGPASLSMDELLKLRDLELDTISKFPSGLIYDRDEVDRLLSGDHELVGNVDKGGGRFGFGVTPEGLSLYAKSLIQLEHLQNMFFVERLLSNRRGPQHRTRDLLAISIDLISLTLLFWTYKNRVSPLRSDYSWLVMSYAVPAGGVLCMELMNPTPVADLEMESQVPLDPNYSRSSIIQKLSVLSAFLSWIKPSSPNGNLIKAVDAVIARVLDHTLNHPQPPASGQPIDLPWAGLDFEMNDYFNFDLMDTFDWLRPEAGDMGRGLP